MSENRQSEIRIKVGKLNLYGNLVLPEEAKSLVIFSHGSGSSRFSPRNNYVAKVLNEGNIATLLTDLLTQEEDRAYETRFNIDLLTDRLIHVTNWMKSLPECKGLSIGYFGASTGAASALCAAAKLQDDIAAIVSRGGRPDMAEYALPKVKAPTLLIVGSLDTEVISLNEEAYRQLKHEKKMEIVKGASHLFEEPGKLEEVSRLASDWFRKYLIENYRNILIT